MSPQNSYVGIMYKTAWFVQYCPGSPPTPPQLPEGPFPMSLSSLPPSPAIGPFDDVAITAVPLGSRAR